MPCVSLQRKNSRFQEETSDIEMQLLKLGLFFEDSIYFNGSAMRNYTREWQYDSVGNILSLIHNANGNAWTRSYDYASDSNRVNSTTVGQTTVNYTYNAHGSMISMPHLQGMQWDFAERLCHITRGTTEAYYNYDGGGQRTRKVVEKNGIVETRLYLGGFEIWRKSVNGVLETERETLHVMDDSTRVAVVETLTIDNAVAVANPVPVLRYQLDNHLGSASLELDDLANVISYEEYYPYGDTSYRSGRTASEVSQKRYRYTGKEKDEESGLYYHGARYYACWLGRWTAADPIGLVDGVNLYMYVNGNPVSGVDPSGTNGEKVLEEDNGHREQPSEMAKMRADAAKTIVLQYKKNNTSYSQEKRQFGIDAQYADCSSLVSTILNFAGQSEMFQSKYTGSGFGEGIQGEIQKKESKENLMSPYRMNDPKIGDIMMWKGHVGLVTDVTETHVKWANMGVSSKAGIQSASLASELDLKKGAEIYSSEFWGFWTPTDEKNKLDSSERKQDSSSIDNVIKAKEMDTTRVDSSFFTKMDLKLNELRYEMNRLTNPMNWILGR